MSSFLNDSVNTPFRYVEESHDLPVRDECINRLKPCIKWRTRKGERSSKVPDRILAGISDAKSTSSQCFILLDAEWFLTNLMHVSCKPSHKSTCSLANMFTSIIKNACYPDFTYICALYDVVYVRLKTSIDTRSCYWMRIGLF